MHFDIGNFIDKGFTTMVAIAAVYFVVQLGRLFTNHIPSVLIQAREFSDTWRDFVIAVENNANAIVKNTEITDMNYRQSQVVLEELREVQESFECHDVVTLDLRTKVMELIRVIEQADNSEEVIRLLQLIIDNMDV